MQVEISSEKPISASLIDSSQAALWRSLVPASKNVFASMDYALITEQHLFYHAALFVYRYHGTLVVYPLFLRSLAQLPFSDDFHAGVWDSASPPYTGPICISNSDEAWETPFCHSLRECFSSNRVVAEFAHLHPWNAFTGSGTGNLQHDRDIIYVDLSLSADQLWKKSFAHSCRKNINRARRERVRVIEAKTHDQIREFHRIYTDTMRRNGAKNEYFYSLSYFLKIFERMKENSRFVLAYHREKVVAGTLYLHDDRDVYSFLGGTDLSSQSVRPNNAVIYETILWGRAQGKKRLILGGGYRPQDGIFRFKATFSPLRAPFHTFKQIHDATAYGTLCRAWSAFYKKPVETGGFFPVYRQHPGD